MGPISYPNPQHNLLKFDRISVEDGLSQASVYAILQDSKGFMWFATQDGLDKYDGYEFTIYRPVPGDDRSLSANYGLSLLEDSEESLWIGTNGRGLNRFNRDTGLFSRYQNNPGDSHSLSHNLVHSIFEDHEGVLWIGTGGGLNQYDPTSDQFNRFQHEEFSSSSLSNNIVRAVLEDHEGVLWVGTEGGGLNKLDRENGTFAHFRHDPSDNSSLSSDRVMTIFEDQDGTLWIGTDGGGLNRYDRSTEHFVHYKNLPGVSNSLGGNSVGTLYEDHSGGLWVGTLGGGLSRFDRKSDQFQNFRHDPNDLYSLSSDWVLSIYEDQSGVLWIGTVGGGVNKLDLYRKNFAHYRNVPHDPDSMSVDLVWSFYEEPSGVLWVGTHGGGLSSFDRENGIWRSFQHDPNDQGGISNNIVRSVIGDSEGLWIGTEGGGVDRFDFESEEFSHYQHDPNDPRSLGNDDVIVVYEDRWDAIWVGTLGGGLNKLDPSTGQFHRYQNDGNNPQSISNDRVRSIFEDQWGYLWVGTEVGLNRYDRRTEQFTRFLPNANVPGFISEFSVLSIFEDHTGVLWAGTFGGGLNRFDRTNGTFTHYREEDGLPSDIINGILEDEAGNLWLSTNNGISKFDPHTEIFTNYDVVDGLQSNEFNAGAYLRSEGGEMFFGGVNGFNAFHPDSIQENPHTPLIALTSLTMGGEGIDFGRALENLEEITFRWPDRSFEFEFVAMSYARPQENQYAYMLEGFDQGWNEIGASRIGKYTNLPAGAYKLRLKAANHDGLWNEPGISINITIVPPFWQTWPFVVVVVVLLFAIAVSLYRLQVRAVEARSTKLEEQVKTRTAELQREIDQRVLAEEALREGEREKAVAEERSRLARDLHDAVTQTLFSATLISEAVPELWEQDPEEGRALLKEIQQLSRGALAEMRTLLMELRPETLSEASLPDLMKQLSESVIGRLGVPVSVKVEGECSVPPDVHVTLYRITQEALNNVVKHAQASQVEVCLRCSYLEGSEEAPGGRRRIELSVRDNGRGFELESTPGDRLGLGILRERAETIGAKIKIESEVGEGTEVKVVWEGGD